jgi:putative transcriptional regulator
MHEEFAEKIAGEIVLSNEPGKTLRKWRQVFGVSQKELAGEMGISHSVVSDYEGGRRRSPTIATVRRVVSALLIIDERRGSPTISKYQVREEGRAIVSMREFPVGITCLDFIDIVEGEIVWGKKELEKRLYGYTLLDSLKVITSLTSFDYLQIYGWSQERALIFMGVEYGRSPMVAIRAHPLKPGMVMYYKPKNVDELAVRLAEIEGIPLVVTEMDVDRMVKVLAKI